MRPGFFFMQFWRPASPAGAFALCHRWPGRRRSARCRASRSSRAGRKCRRNSVSATCRAFAVNAQDQVFLLHRPRTLKPDQAAMAGPPVMVFDAAGNYVKGWGGAGPGYEWIEREHGIHIDYKGFVWIGGNNCPTSNPAGTQAGLRRPAPEVHAGRQVRAADRARATRARATPIPRTSIARPMPGSIRAPTKCSSPTATAIIAPSCSTPTPARSRRMWGAFSNKPAGQR